MAKKAKKAAQADLPTLEDRAIKPLQDSAIEYAEIRDQRIALNAQEHELKKRVRDIMRKHNKTRYAYDGVEITLIDPGTEPDVKVKIAKKKDGDNDEAVDE